MAVFTLRWANRSNSTQDWMVSNGDSFQLLPNYVRSVNLTINNDYVFQIAVSTNRGFAAATLTYTGATQAWTLASPTPAEWQLATGGGIVTLRCLLENVAALDLAQTGYVVSAPAAPAEG